MANLHTAENTLNAQQAQLEAQQGQAQQAVATEQAAVRQNAQEIQAQQSALAEENGKIAALIKQQQDAEVAAAAAQVARAREAAAQVKATTASSTASSSPGLGNFAPPPTAPGGLGAVQAAESQEGVPYVWGAESPKGSASRASTARDSRLAPGAKWASRSPDFSGAQMADSTPYR